MHLPRERSEIAQGCEEGNRAGIRENFTAQGGCGKQGSSLCKSRASIQAGVGQGGRRIRGEANRGDQRAQVGRCQVQAAVKCLWTRTIAAEFGAAWTRTWFHVAFRLSKAAPARRLVEDTSAVFEREPLLGSARIGTVWVSTLASGNFCGSFRTCSKSAFCHAGGRAVLCV